LLAGIRVLADRAPTDRLVHLDRCDDLDVILVASWDRWKSEDGVGSEAD
jgi:hypothetical protein